MGRRQGTIEPRVIVSVSESMANLRMIQEELNGFWQSSELSYGFFLSHADTLFADKQRPTVELLGYVKSEVWYPNNQGRIKHEENIGSTLNEVRKNTVHVYRASLLSFCSAFEAYLDGSVPHAVKPKQWNWGPFIETLSIDSLIFAPCPVQLRTILCADLVREIRNKMIHKAFWVPQDKIDPVVLAWEEYTLKKALVAKNALMETKNGWTEDKIAEKLKNWTDDKIKENIHFAKDQVVNKAINHVNEGARKGKELPIELFYMIFTFTNLDSLAFEIQEALLPPDSITGYSVTRKKAAVRRSDLIIESDIIE
jgi:hypothetical protein